MDLIQRALEVSVTSYTQDPHDSGTILYNVEVKNKAGKSWLLIKRYSQFDELQRKLREYFGPSIPALPKKSYITFFVGKSQEELEERRRGLNEFLKATIQKTEVYNSVPYREFLELDKHTSLQIHDEPKLICEFKGFEHGVRDFSLDLQNGILFTIHSDMNVLTRVDAYMTNMKLPWESEKGEPTLVLVGCLECWIRNEEGEYKKSWNKGYNAQAITIYWDPLSFTLLVGLDSGSINLLTVPEKVKFKKYTESMEIEQHFDRVMGLYYDSKRSLIHSVSKDHRYRILDINSEALVADLEPGSFELTYLLVDQERQKSFVGDRCGSIFIYDVSNLKPTAVVHLMTTLKFIRGLYVDDVKNYLFAIGLEEGEMIVFDINKSGREVEAKEVARMRNRPQSREICWSSSRGEIYAGNQDGSITVWDAKKASPICSYQIFNLIQDVLKAHEEDITKIFWLEKEHTLLTGSKDKSIKAWKFPISWFEQKSVEKEEKEAEKVIRQQIVQEIKNQNDSDEEDLTSWHK